MERKALNYLRWGILFTFLNFSIGSLNILPDFVGMLLFYASIASHAQPMRDEEKIKPLFLVLAADYFLHWIWKFGNGIELLLTSVIQLYAIFVLLGAAAERFREGQPDKAKLLDGIRVWSVFIQAYIFLVSPYKIGVLNSIAMIAAITLCVVLAVVLFFAEPREAQEG